MRLNGDVKSFLMTNVQKNKSFVLRRIVMQFVLYSVKGGYKVRKLAWMPSADSEARMSH